ncbi:ribosomal protein L7/L12 [Longispora sp. K20-0274]|uniref:ribosomal protein L7/L12 n=1 Tax=Longispora sp. K20-0274 TaxID=3088255 RepID=UPI00399B1CB0
MRAIDAARSRIVLIGTPAYDDPELPDVPAVTNNLSDLAAVLTDPRLGGFSPAHCAVTPPGADVSRVGDLLVRAATEAEDLLLIYYSGHGMLGPLRRELYLSVAGTRPDMLAFTALAFEAVRDICLGSRARNRVVILDSCFSGRAIGETLAGTEESVLGQLQVAGTYTLTSSPANRVALTLPGERNTAFTGRLLALLRAGSPTAGPVLSLGDIYRHLHVQLRAEGLPVPQQRGTETADQLGLVRNAATGAPPPVAAPPAWTLPPARTPQPPDEFDVVLHGHGARLIQVIKVVRELTWLGLKEAKDLVEGAPALVLRQVDGASAESARVALVAAGATVTVRSSHTGEQPRSARFDVVLHGDGGARIAVIKVVREVAALQLWQAKDLVERAPAPVLRGVDRVTADRARAVLEAAGAWVRIAQVG